MIPWKGSRFVNLIVLELGAFSSFTFAISIPLLCCIVDAVPGRAGQALIRTDEEPGAAELADAHLVAIVRDADRHAHRRPEALEERLEDRDQRCLAVVLLRVEPEAALLLVDAELEAWPAATVQVVIPQLRGSEELE